MKKITDTERLDWLDASRWGHRRVFGRLERTFNGNFYFPCNSPVREAIDALICPKKSVRKAK